MIIKTCLHKKITSIIHAFSSTTIKGNRLRRCGETRIEFQLITWLYSQMKQFFQLSTMKLLIFIFSKSSRTNYLICYYNNTTALKTKYAGSTTKTALMNMYERFQAMHPIRSAEIKWTL